MILVVDDEEEFLEEILELLRRRGIPCLGQTDPREALRLVAKRPEIDLVLTDWRMPGLDGVALMTAAQCDPCARRDRIFIVMTEHEGDAGTLIAKERGAALVLKKPFQEIELVDALSSVGWSARERSSSQ